MLLGVTGGIAAYKAAELCRLLVKAGHDVVPVLTRGAERFVTAETFRALARRPAPEGPYPHLERFDLVVIAPLTANTLAKLAYGIADNVLTEAVLAHKGPILVAPAMNPRMWSNPATRANVQTLVARGFELVGPDEGEMAEGEWGVGRMSEPVEIAARVGQLLAPGPLEGLRVLVTAGGTREPVDSVRFVGNRSSGRMGVALAEEARRRGADVTLLAANLAVPPPGTCRDDRDADRGGDARRRARARGRGRRAAGRGRCGLPSGRGTWHERAKSSDGWTLELEPTADVALALGERKRPGQVLVAFGAEHGEDGLERKRRMLDEKRADLVVYNDVSREDIGFDAPDNEVVLVTSDRERRVPKASKREIAAAILDEVESLLGRDR